DGHLSHGKRHRRVVDRQAGGGQHDREPAMMNQKGFSLAELLIAAAMTSLLMAGVFVILQQGENAYMHGAGRAEVQQTARGALDRIARELRTGSNVTAVTAASVNAGSISFQYVDDTATTVTVTYSLNGTNLQ